MVRVFELETEPARIVPKSPEGEETKLKDAGVTPDI